MKRITWIFIDALFGASIAVAVLIAIVLFFALTGCSTTPTQVAPITPPVYSDVRVFIIDPEDPALVFKRPAPTLDGRICEVCRQPMWEEYGHYELRHNLKPFVK